MIADVERLSNRLAAMPTSFRLATSSSARATAEPKLEAVVADLFRDRASRALSPAETGRFALEGASPAKRRHLELVAAASWLLHDATFSGASADALLSLAEGRLAALAERVVPRLFVEDAERREELVRTCLAALGILPAGETAEAAEDRLAVLDSVKRHELLRAARAREQERERERKRRQAELEKLRQQEEEERRKAARTTFED